ncbi:MAG TPA: hypothetical protein DCM27_05405 [Rhodospirillaceae bacterium]|nr:hypothetical protein [Rhodospirillaceae bacterium]
MRHVLLCAFLIACPILSSRAADMSSAYDRVVTKNELVCGIYAWAPYKELDPNTGEWKGFAVDIYRKAFATLDIKVIFKEVVLGNQVQDLNSGRIDAMCDDGPWILSAGKFVEYSNPAYIAITFPYVRIDEKRFKKRSDFNSPDVSFTGIDGDLSSDLAHRLFPAAKLLSAPSTTDISQLYLNVQTGKADIMIGDPASFSIYNKNNPGKLKALFTDRPIAMYKNVVSVKKGDAKMLGLVNQAIDNALALGIVDTILDDFDPQHKLLMRVRLPYGF